MSGVVAGRGTKRTIALTPYRSVYDSPYGQFVAVKARSPERREKMEHMIFVRHNARPLFRLNVKVKP